MRNKLHKIIEITDDVISREYELGQNDCNTLVLRVIDLMAGTDYTNLALGKYKSITGGKKVFRENGFKHLTDLVTRHCTEVPFPIMGDIYIEEGGVNASVILNNTYISVDHENNKFNNKQLPSEMAGKFYRFNKE